MPEVCLAHHYEMVAGHCCVAIPNRLKPLLNHESPCFYLLPANAGLGGHPLAWRRLLMAETRFTDTIEEKVALIAPTLKAIEFGGDLPYLCELQVLLRQHLASLVVLYERDPGLDAATADLYAAAAAIVNDTTMTSQPLARKRRLLKEAQTRFQEHISTARPNGRRACAAWRQNELFLAT
jgi:hypothetical protein